MTTTNTQGEADLIAVLRAVRDTLQRDKHNGVYDEKYGPVLQQRMWEAWQAHAAHAARAPADSDLITIRKPTTSAEMLWLLKLAHLVISDVAKTLEESFAPAQPAIEASRFGSPELQAMIIARCVEKDQADSVLEDAAFEAVRKNLCALPRYSFVLDDDGLVRRVLDRSGNWIEFDEAHALFDPVSVDAARKQGEKQ